MISFLKIIKNLTIWHIIAIFGAIFGIGSYFFNSRDVIVNNASSGVSGIDNVTRDYLQRRAVKLATLLGTHPTYNSWFESDAEAFAILKEIHEKHESHRLFFVSMYEVLTGNNFYVDITLLDNQHEKQLKLWGWL